MEKIIYPADYNKSTLKKFATNIPLLEKIIRKYVNKYPNTKILFKFQEQSRNSNEISFFFQLEHTLVLSEGRDLKGARVGKIPSIYHKNKFYHVRIDNINGFNNFKFVIEYSKPNIYNLETSNSLSNTNFNKIIYIPPIPYDYSIPNPQERNIDIFTSFHFIGNSKRREIFINKMKSFSNLNDYTKKNITNIFNIDELKKIYNSSKVVINVHQTEHHHTFEEFRVLPALLAGCLIISEEVPCKDEIPYHNYIIWTNMDNIHSKINEVLSNYEIYFNNIFSENSGLKEVFEKMINDAENDFFNKISKFEELDKYISCKSKLKISEENMDDNLIFDFNNYTKKTKELEREFKRLLEVEKKYNDLYDENKLLRKQIKLLKNDKIPQSEHFSLSKCALDYGLDKIMRFKDGKHVFGHNFISSYNKLFKDYDIDEVEDVFEIGIGCLEKGQMGGHNGTITKYGYKTGNSLRMWRDYFINANIHGIDIYKEAMIYDEDRIITYICDQSNKEQLNKLLKDDIKKKMDIIVDDGSHELNHQIISFEILTPYLKKGGIYVIECIQPKNISSFLNLSVFRNKKEIEDKFEITHYDTRKDTNKNDDFMVTFKLK